MSEESSSERRDRRTAHRLLADQSIDVTAVVSWMDAVPTCDPHAVDGFLVYVPPWCASEFIQFSCLAGFDPWVSAQFEHALD